jgi:hypothetical protein
MDQLNPKAIDHSQQAGIDQEALRLILMCDGRAEQPDRLRQFWGERLLIAHQPAIRGAIAGAFLRNQYAYLDDLAGLQVRRAVFRHSFDRIIKVAKQCSDKVVHSQDISPLTDRSAVTV